MAQDMSPDQAIAALRKLPEEKQRAVLGRLTPENRKGILAKLTSGQPAPATPPATAQPSSPGIRQQIDAALQPGNETGLVGRLKEGVKGAVAGIVGPYLHPIQTTSGMGSMVEATGTPYGTPAFAPTGNRAVDEANMRAQQQATAGLQEQADFARQHPAYALGTVAGPVLAGKAGEAVVERAPTVEGLKARVANAGRNLIGVGSEDVAKKAKGVIEQAGVEADKVREQNKAATERILGERGRVDERNDAAVKAANERTERARGAVDERNKKADAAHLKQVVKQAQEDAERIGRAKEKRERVEGENEQAGQEHKGAVVQTQQERDALEQTNAMRDQAEQQYQKLSNDYFANEEAERTKAKTAENTAWNGWREKMRTYSSPDESLVSGLDRLKERSPEIRQALEQITPEPEDAGPESEYAFTRRQVLQGQGYGNTPYDDLRPNQKADVDHIMNSLGLEPDPIDFNPQSGEPISAEQVHQAKSILGWKLARREYPGVIEGDMKQAYKLLQQAESRMSVNAGAADELMAGKKATQTYQNAFGRVRPDRTTQGDVRMRELNRDIYNKQREDQRVAAIAQVNPDLANQYRGVQTAAEHANSFPSEDALRRSLPQAPNRPNLKDVPEVPQPRPLPEAPPAEQYPEPEAVTREQYGEPGKNANRPIERPEFNVDEEQRKTIEQFRDRFKLTGYDAGILATSVIGNVVRSVLGPTAEGIRRTAMYYVTGKALARNILSREGVVAFLAKPTPAVVEALGKLPNADRIKIIHTLTDIAVEGAHEGKLRSLSPDMAKLAGPVGAARIAAAMASVTSQAPKTPAEAKKRVEEARKPVSDR